MQVSVSGHPVYYFAGDQSAGQTNGQGVGGVWFLAGPDGSPVGAPSASEAPSAAPSASMTAEDSFTITLVESSDGAFLAGEAGRSLYVLTNDPRNTSTCSGGCAANWPAFVLKDGETAIAGDGVSGTIATFARSDGSMQVSVGDHPVYYFAGDQAAGDTNGQGINGVWFLAGPDGSPVGATVGILGG